MRCRLANLDLLQKYGANAWRVHNYQLEQMHKGLQGDLQSAQGQITELNRKRKLEQVRFQVLSFAHLFFFFIFFFHRHKHHPS